MLKDRLHVGGPFTVTLGLHDSMSQINFAQNIKPFVQQNKPKGLTKGLNYNTELKTYKEMYYEIFRKISIGVFTIKN